MRRSQIRNIHDRLFKQSSNKVRLIPDLTFDPVAQSIGNQFNTIYKIASRSLDRSGKGSVDTRSYSVDALIPQNSLEKSGYLMPVSRSKSTLNKLEEGSSKGRNLVTQNSSKSR